MGDQILGDPILGYQVWVISLLSDQNLEIISWEIGFWEIWFWEIDLSGSNFRRSSLVRLDFRRSSFGEQPLIRIWEIRIWEIRFWEIGLSGSNFGKSDLERSNGDVSFGRSGLSDQSLGDWKYIIEQFKILIFLLLRNLPNSWMRLSFLGQCALTWFCLLVYIYMRHITFPKFSMLNIRDLLKKNNFNLNYKTYLMVTLACNFNGYLLVDEHSLQHRMNIYVLRSIRLALFYVFIVWLHLFYVRQRIKLDCRVLYCLSYKTLASYMIWCLNKTIIL